MTNREALAEGTALLKAANIDTPSLDASLLLAEVLHTTRSALIAAAPDPVTEDTLTQFKALLDRRLSGECIAYILGRKEFRGLEFTVTPAVLVPRPDTETLVEAALEKLRVLPPSTLHRTKGSTPPSPLVLDLCTGSGAIAISLKHEMPNLEVWASDVSEAALEIAKNNAVKLLSPKDNLTEPIRFFQGDLFSTLHRTKGSTPPFLIPHFSLIVSNPPYIPTGEIEALSPEVQKEPHLALDGGSDGLDLIRAIIKAAPAHLYPGGGLFMEADPRQMKTIAILLETQGFIDIQNYKDLSGEDRVIGGTMTG